MLHQRLRTRVRATISLRSRLLNCQVPKDLLSSSPTVLVITRTNSLMGQMLANNSSRVNLGLDSLHRGIGSSQDQSTKASNKQHSARANSKHHPVKFSIKHSHIKINNQTKFNRRGRNPASFLNNRPLGSSALHHPLMLRTRLPTFLHSPTHSIKRNSNGSLSKV